MEHSRGTPESALEICNRNIKFRQCGEKEKKSGCGTSKRSKLQKSSKNGTYITGSQRPHHTSMCSFPGRSGQETKGESANPDNLLGWDGATTHSQFLKDTKYYLQSSIRLTNQIKERQTCKMIFFVLCITQGVLEGLSEYLYFGAELPDICISVLLSFSLRKHESK